MLHNYEMLIKDFVQREFVKKPHKIHIPKYTKAVNS